MTELAGATEYFRKKGLEIEVCGGIKGDSLIIDFVVAETVFPESLIKTGTEPFAIIPEDQFTALTESGAITDVTAKTFITGSGELPGKIGKANITVKGRSGDKDFQGVSIAGIKFNEKFDYGGILGLEFVNSFDFNEMGWPGDPVVGFYGCKKISP